MTRLLEDKSETELLLIVSAILARPGDFTPIERVELAVINDELFIREQHKKEREVTHMPPTMINHNSKMMNQSGYDDATGEMHITFANGKTYKFKVPKETHDQLVAAKSQGQFFNANIRGKVDGKSV